MPSNNVSPRLFTVDCQKFTGPAYVENYPTLVPIAQLKCAMTADTARENKFSLDLAAKVLFIDARGWPLMVNPTDK